MSGYEWLKQTVVVTTAIMELRASNTSVGQTVKLMTYLYIDMHVLRGLSGHYYYTSPRVYDLEFSQSESKNIYLD